MLNWSRFEELPGSPAINFEKLCRGIVRRHFSHLGPLFELKNQPGVEYYISLNNTHQRLGNSGENVGWQCKWFEYRADKGLTSQAKSQIEHSLKKTNEHIPDLTHWILWTHKTLTKSDQDWYYGLKSTYGLELHLWNENDLEELLSGQALDLKHSYFGELALTEQMLYEQHEKSVSPIQTRWIHDAHQIMEVEDKVRQILGEPQAWAKLAAAKGILEEICETISEAIHEQEYNLWENELSVFSNSCRDFISYCAVFESSISGESVLQINDFISCSSNFSNQEISKVLGQLRRANLPLSLTITNALAYIRDIRSLLVSAGEMLSTQFLAIVADAGGGKTQLSAEISSPSKDRPAGILILGRLLRKGDSLDSLAKRFTFYGKQLDNFEALVSATDAAGTRAGCRLPIVIDGLNEAQDPRDWKALLSSIEPVLKKYPNVVLVVTLRTGERPRNRYSYHAHENQESRESFTRQALPENTTIFESDGFSDQLTIKAITSYFHVYKIEADPFIAPISFFSHPLNLRIFCDVTNPKAEETVQVAHFPSSIYSLFAEQVRHIATSISSMTNLSRSYTERDIAKVVYLLGQCLWEDKSRSTSENKFREISGYSEESWEDDIVNLLAQEGLIFRDNGDIPYEYYLTPVYDRLGGYLVANFLLLKNSRQEFSTWIGEEEFIDSIFGKVELQHELSEDIFHALIALTPKCRYGEQVWKNLEEPYSSKALFLSHLIDKDDFCQATRDAYKAGIIREKLPRRILESLRSTLTAVEHPLNADFLNEVLLKLSITERDLSWTENIREIHDRQIESLQRSIKNYKQSCFGNPEADRLRMVSVSWLLTSTAIEVRDLATEALYLYGISNSENLFSILKSLIRVDDPYVLERLLAATYGTVVFILTKSGKNPCLDEIANFIYEEMFSDSGKATTTHILARDYASSILKAVAKASPNVAINWNADNYIHPFTGMPCEIWGTIEVKGEVYNSDSPLRMDFANYTIGRLVPNRHNYDFDDPEYEQVRGKILWRIHQLGWDYETFKDVESKTQDHFRYSRTDRPRIERYGKKYSWIAYYEVAGQLHDEDKLEYWNEYRFCTDIDPFFPEEVSQEELDHQTFLESTEITTPLWITDSNSESHLSGLLEHTDDKGSWVLIDAYISEASKKLDRNFYCSVHPFLIPNNTYSAFDKYKQNNKEVRIPDHPQTGHLFSGEIYSKHCAELDTEGSITFTVGYKEKHIETPQIIINGEVLDEATTKVIDEPINEYIEVQHPVVKYYWENSGGRVSSMERLMLSPMVVDLLDLSFNPITFEYSDSNGEKAVKYIQRKAKAISNYHELMYLRKDLIEQLESLSDHKLVKKLHGERRYDNVDNLHSDSDKLVRYVTFDDFLS